MNEPSPPLTYTLPEEGGSSLRAAGWFCVGESGGGSWGRGDWPCEDRHPTAAKLRWEVDLISFAAARRKQGRAAYIAGIVNTWSGYDAW